MVSLLNEGRSSDASMNNSLCSDVFVPSCHFPAFGDGDWATSTSSCLPGRQPYPTLTCAVFFDVEVFLPVEENFDTAFQIRCIVELARWIGAKSVGRGGVGHLLPLHDFGFLGLSRE